MTDTAALGHQRCCITPHTEPTLLLLVPSRCRVGSLFNTRIVGTANAIAAGNGNAGAGFTLLLMPLIYESIKDDLGYNEYWAWRLAFIFPGILHIAGGCLCYFCMVSVLCPCPALTPCALCCALRTVLRCQLCAG